jgi:hypothetical protein
MPKRVQIGGEREWLGLGSLPAERHRGIGESGCFGDTIAVQRGRDAQVE